MQAIMETLFDAVYLTTVVTLGIIMMLKADGRKELLLFGIMSVLLGCGDAFHLVPRALALCTSGLDSFVVSLGIGKLITSITMTIFYIILFYIWKMHYKIKGKVWLDVSVLMLAFVRILLCFMPQNAWTSENAPLSWGIYRNIPFALMGILIIVLFFIKARETHDKQFKWMWLAITLSFGFYIPVVLVADKIPLIGMLMIPKTCAYVWVVYMGFSQLVKEFKEGKIENLECANLADNCESHAVKTEENINNIPCDNTNKTDASNAKNVKIDKNNSATEFILNNDKANSTDNTSTITAKKKVVKNTTAIDKTAENDKNNHK